MMKRRTLQAGSSKNSIKKSMFSGKTNLSRSFMGRSPLSYALCKRHSWVGELSAIRKDLETRHTLPRNKSNDFHSSFNQQVNNGISALSINCSLNQFG